MRSNRQLLADVPSPAAYYRRAACAARRDTPSMDLPSFQFITNLHSGTERAGARAAEGLHLRG